MFKNIKLDKEKIIFAIFSFISISPIWVFDFLAMVDYPQHLSQLSNSIRLLDDNEFINSHYYFNLLTPYLSTNILLVILSKLIGPKFAIKIAISTYLIIIPLTCRKLLTLEGKSKELSLICFPLLFGTSFSWGFINFLFTISFCSLWISNIISRRNQEISKIDIIVSTLLSMGHAIAWGLTMYYILILKLYNKDYRVKIVTQYVLISLPLIILIYWAYYISVFEPSTKDVSTFIFGSFLYKFCVLFFGNILQDDILFGTISFILLYLTCRNHLYIERKIKLYHYLIISSLLLFFLTPTLFLSTAFFSDRLLILLPIFI
ncbi:hypothetical protein FCV82_06895, partial [Vibrio breoganii]